MRALAINIEGMSAGRPFVASDVEGVQEITRGAVFYFNKEIQRLLPILFASCMTTPRITAKWQNGAINEPCNMIFGKWWMRMNNCTMRCSNNISALTRMTLHGLC